MICNFANQGEESTIDGKEIRESFVFWILLKGRTTDYSTDCNLRFWHLNVVSNSDSESVKGFEKLALVHQLVDGTMVCETYWNFFLSKMV